MLLKKEIPTFKLNKVHELWCLRYSYNPINQYYFHNAIQFYFYIAYLFLFYVCFDDDNTIFPLNVIGIVAYSQELLFVDKEQRTKKTNTTQLHHREIRITTEPDKFSYFKTMFICTYPKYFFFSITKFSSYCRREFGHHV